VQKWNLWLDRIAIPPFAGALASALLLAASGGYGAVKGGHVPMMVEALADIRDQVADAAGFRLTGVLLAGEGHVSRSEILAAVGVTERTSLLFLDVAASRARIEAIPWVADANVRKLYPDRLQIRIRERVPFAVWQLDGKLSVIAADGTVLCPLDASFADLPLVVGPGAQTRARDLFARLDRFPMLRDQVRASVWVGDRRWNLKLKNGVDVRLPETEIDRAMDLVVRLDRDRQLLRREIVAVDLRLKDRVTVRLFERAARERDEARKTVRHKRSEA
jgi:cell division protein FtsQ